MHVKYNFVIHFLFIFLFGSSVFGQALFLDKDEQGVGFAFSRPWNKTVEGFSFEIGAAQSEVADFSIFFMRADSGYNHKIKSYGFSATFLPISQLRHNFPLSIGLIASFEFADVDYNYYPSGSIYGSNEAKALHTGFVLARRSYLSDKAMISTTLFAAFLIGDVDGWTEGGKISFVYKTSDKIRLVAGFGINLFESETTFSPGIAIVLTTGKPDRF